MFKLSVKKQKPTQKTGKTLQKRWFSQPLRPAGWVWTDFDRVKIGSSGFRLVKIGSSGFRLVKINYMGPNFPRTGKRWYQLSLDLKRICWQVLRSLCSPCTMYCTPSLDINISPLEEFGTYCVSCPHNFQLVSYFNSWHRFYATAILESSAPQHFYLLLICFEEWNQQ